jgi:hypothetical protein
VIVTEKGLGCESCGREIPAKPLWTALSRRARLHCSGCKHQVTQNYLMAQGEVNEAAKAMILAYGHLAKFGWMSHDSLENAGVVLNPQMIGGLLTGLTRAGLIRRGSPSDSVLARLVDPRPVFVPGPSFPTIKPTV